ncbi:peptidoglycan-binding protein [Patescibacteria group bacterium]
MKRMIQNGVLIMTFFLFGLVIFAAMQPNLRNTQATAGLINSTTATKQGATTISGNLAPAPEVGNLLIAVVGARDNVSITPPAGWQTAIQTSGTPSQAIFYRLAEGGVSLFSFTTSGSSNLGLQLYEYTDIDLTQTLDQVGFSIGSGAIPFSGVIETEEENELIFSAFTINANTSFTAFSNGFIEQNDFINGGAPSGRSTYAGADLIIETQGLFSTQATVGVSGDWVGQVVSFKQTLPEGSGGTGFQRVFPKNSLMKINNQATCTPERTINLLLSSENAHEVVVSESPYFKDARWMSFISPLNLNWQLQGADGEKTVYAIFRSVTQDLSTPVFSSITLDQDGNCGVPRLEPEPVIITEPEEIEKVVSVDGPPHCELVTFDLYIINPDGSERHMESKFAQIEAVYPGVIRVRFEDRGDDFDFNDLWVKINKQNFRQMIVTLERLNADWHHQVRMRISRFGHEADFLLWGDSHQAIFERPLSVNLMDHEFICAKEGIKPSEVSVRNQVIVYDQKNYQGNSEAFMLDSAVADLRGHIIGNDQIVSIVIPSGEQVALYQNKDYLGGSEILTQNDPDLSDNIIGINSVSSLRTGVLSVYGGLVCENSTKFDRFLSQGSSGLDVFGLQKLLQCLGDFSKDIEPNGYFGPATIAAVKRFQAENGIESVGYVGPSTRAALNEY